MSGTVGPVRPSSQDVVGLLANSFPTACRNDSRGPTWYGATAMALHPPGPTRLCRSGRSDGTRNDAAGMQAADCGTPDRGALQLETLAIRSLDKWKALRRNGRDEEKSLSWLCEVRTAVSVAENWPAGAIWIERAFTLSSDAPARAELASMRGRRMPRKRQRPLLGAGGIVVFSGERERLPSCIELAGQCGGSAGSGPSADRDNNQRGETHPVAMSAVDAVDHGPTPAARGDEKRRWHPRPVLE